MNNFNCEKILRYIMYASMKRLTEKFYFERL